MPRNPGHPHIAIVRSLLTHCISGHEFTEQNTYIARNDRNRPNPYRQCKKCRAIREANRRNRMRNENE